MRAKKPEKQPGHRFAVPVRHLARCRGMRTVRSDQPYPANSSFPPPRSADRSPAPLLLPARGALRTRSTSGEELQSCCSAQAALPGCSHWPWVCATGIPLDMPGPRSTMCNANNVLLPPWKIPLPMRPCFAFSQPRAGSEPPGADTNMDGLSVPLSPPTDPCGNTYPS